MTVCYWVSTLIAGWNLKTANMIMLKLFNHVFVKKNMSPGFLNDHFALKCVRNTLFFMIKHKNRIRINNKFLDYKT